MSAAGPRAPGGAQILEQVRILASKARDLAREVGRAELVAALDAQTGRTFAGEATVVVAGAQKRGKSSLLNALVGVPALLPVDADIATDTYIVLGRGTTLTATVITRGPPPGRHPIEPRELADYASVLGAPERRRGVEGVEVTVPSPVLDGVRLVDTPGVDSLTLGHRHATVAALTGADALLFTVSAQDQPVSRSELEFLIDAAPRVHNVAFVFTKVDDSGSTAALLAENHVRLAAFLDEQGVPEPLAGRLRDAPWLGVSAVLADAAARLAGAGRLDRAARRRESSGMDVLVAHLRGLAERRHLLRHRALLDTTALVLDDLGTTSQDRVVAHSTDPAAIEQRRAEIAAEGDRVKGLRRELRAFRVDHQLVVSAAIRTAHEGLERASRDYEHEIQGLGTTAGLEDYARRLEESIERSLDAVWTDVTREAERAAHAVVDRRLSEVGITLTALDLPRRDEAGQDRLDYRRPTSTFDVFADGVPPVMMASSLTSLLVASTGLVGVFVLPAVALGGAVAFGVLRQRRQKIAVARTRKALDDAVGTVFSAAKAEMKLELESAATQWRSEIETAVNEVLDDRMDELRRRSDQLSAVEEADKEARKVAQNAALELDRRVRGLGEQIPPLRAVLGADP